MGRGESSGRQEELEAELDELELRHTVTGPAANPLRLVRRG